MIILYIYYLIIFLVLFWVKMRKHKGGLSGLSRLAGLGDMLPLGRCCLDLHLELKLWKSCSAVGGSLQETGREHANL